MRSRFTVLGIVALVLALAVPAAAQEFRGRINGTVTDNSGAILPGVTVTATSPALIQPMTAVTGEDGTYRLIALPAGTYVLTYELQGFQTLKREAIRVVINTTLSVDAQLSVAALQETVTVTGESPVVDTSTTTVGTNFTNELLTEIPNARDIWAAMAQAPGFQVTGYDVGGSHTGTQTGFVTYGVSQQNTTRIEGINTTEGASANAGYFDFGSFEEFQLGGAGNDAAQDVPGASLNITVKSGGDRFQGMFYGDFENDSTISDNVPGAFATPYTKDDNGFFTTAPGGLATGNPITKQYDINFNLGGPLWKGKAWWFFSYRLNNQYKTIIGLPDLAQSKLTNPYTIKGTFQISKNNQLIGYMNKREKLQDKRDLGPAVPLSASYYQSSRNYPWKAEWTSVLSDRMFLDVIAGNWYNFFPLRPQTEFGNWPVDQFVPGRVDLTSGNFFNGGANNYYQDQKRFKPQFNASLAYFKDGWHGSHDFKFGFEARRDRRKLFNDQPFDIWYRDRNALPSEVDLYNSPVEGINDVNVRSAYIQDSWKFNNKLTLNLGVRVDHYWDGWPEQSHTPNGLPQLSGSLAPLPPSEQTRLTNFFAPKTVDAQTVSKTTTVGPRAGFAYDLRGNGKSVMKGFYGRYYFNSADIIADNQNPVGAAQLRYNFIDRNGNRLLDGPNELGSFIAPIGGGGFVTVDPNLERPYGEELSAHFEQELREGLSGRVSYVYKNIRNDWAEVDVTRNAAQTIPRLVVDRGPDGILGNADDSTVTLFDFPAGTPSQRVFTNPDDPAYKSDYNTVEFAVNRRFRSGWMVLTSFEYTWLNEFVGVGSTTSVLSSAGNTKAYSWNDNLRQADRETTTLWNYKLIGRYTLPWDIGTSGSYKLQSGRQWGRSINLAAPAGTPALNIGSQTVRVEPVTANRAPNVHIVDLRFDKSFRLPGRAGRVVGMIDVFNLFNLGTPIVFRTQTGNVTAGAPFGNFKEVLALLDPRIVRFGIRYEF
jgi:Carboxypeptidase regulatory-like domain/TonB dependent receptor